MIHIECNRLKELFGSFSKVKLAVIGDLMLDRYVWGSVSRISPEAPVPVVNVESESIRFGGSANVALNVSALGASVYPIGLIGADPAGQDLKCLFIETGFETKGLIVDLSRPTTVKTRIIADGQHVVRTDYEQILPVSEIIQDQIISLLESCKSDLDGIIMEDYNKGLFTPALIQKIVAFADQCHLMTFVDPKYDHFFEYKNVTLFKPNRKEAADRLGMRLKTQEDINTAAQKLFNKLDCQAVLVTLGADGMILYEQNQPPQHVPTKAVKVHDVSGAGDTVISTMAVAMAAGGSMQEAATLANHAAGIVCGEVGIVPINPEILLKTMMNETESHIS